MVVRVNRRFASERGSSELATAVRDHFIHIHVELRAAAGHPDMQGKHVCMLACEDFIASLNYEFVWLIVEAAADMIGIRGGLLQDRECRDHLARDQVFPNAEVFERPLRLRSPQFVTRYIDFTETVGLSPHRRFIEPVRG
jgi:hypothetical protein